MPGLAELGGDGKGRAALVHSANARAFLVRLITVLALVNGLAFAFAGLAVWRSHFLYQQQAETVAQNFTQLLQHDLTTGIDRIDTALASVIDEVEHQRSRGVDEQMLDEVVTRQHERTPGVLGMRVTDAQGFITHFAGDGLGKLVYAGDRDYFQKLRDGSYTGLIISAPIYGRISQKWIVVFARRLPDVNGAFSGIVFAPVPVDYFEKVFAALDLGPTGAVVLRDASLTAVARLPAFTKDGASAIGQTKVSPELAGAISRGEQGGIYVARAGIDGIERTFSFRKLAAYPMYVVVGLATQDYFAGWQREVVKASVLLALFVAMTAVSARWGYRAWLAKSRALAEASVASARLEAILGNTPIGIAMVDNDRHIIKANPALADIFRVDLATLAGRRSEVLYASTEEFEALGARAYPKARAGGTSRDVIKMRRRDGAEFWCKLTGRLIEPGNPDGGFVWVFEDVSEQMAAEEALRVSEERFRLLLDGVRDYAIYRLSPGGRVVTWNSGAQAIKGYDADEIIGKHFSLFFTPEDVSAGVPEEALRQAAAQGRFEQEGWRVRKDGSRFWANVTITALRDANGAIHGFAKITRDISERHQAEAQIRRLMTYQQAILDNTPAGIAIVDLNRVIVQNNEAFGAIYGRENEKLAGRSALILYGDPAQCDDVGRRAYPLIKSGGTFCDDILMTRRNGSPVWVRLVAHLVDPAQPELGAVWVAQDISALKQLNEDLARSNADLERFAYVASHDLREPLRMVASYLSLIERRAKAKLDGDELEFLAFAVDGAKRMDRMIVDLLDYSRIGRIGAEFQEVPLAEAVASALDNLSLPIAEAGAEVTVPAELPVVQGSPTEMERLFQNLIGNAVKFRAEDRPPKVVVTCREDGDRWLLSVSDNGIGIDPAQHDRLFAVFSRLVPRDKYEGTGIGLAACRRIIERHGGRIWVESQLDQGCTFHFTLAKG